MSRRRPICPSVGSGCDTRLRVENGSQGRAKYPAVDFVTKITKLRMEDGEEDGGIFVKNFAKHENPSNSSPFPLRGGTNGNPGTHNRGALKPASGAPLGLARMLHPCSITMYADSSSMTPAGLTFMGGTWPNDGHSSGAPWASSFFCFLCEHFHN